jgi:hypothetical protein
LLIKGRDLWRDHCVRIFKLQEVFSFIESSQALLIRKGDSMIDDGNSSFLSISVQCLRDSLLSSKGLKILNALIEDVLFQTQHLRQAFLDKKQVDLGLLSVLKDIVQMLKTV